MKTESELNIPNAQQSAHPFVLHDERGPDGEAFLEGLFGPGLTKLELLAGMAMQGLLAGSYARERAMDWVKNHPEEDGDAYMAAWAVHAASALLSELEKQKGLK